MSKTNEIKSVDLLMSVIKKLKAEILCSRMEEQKANDQLNCLLFLIKRAWKGDNTANLHLSNIIGVHPPKEFNSVRDGTVIKTESCQTLSSVPSRVIQNWEMLTIRLLDREYAQIEKEIKERQWRYIERRSKYMEEILSDHYKQMEEFSFFGGVHKMDYDERKVQPYSSKPKKLFCHGQKSAHPCSTIRKYVKATDQSLDAFIIQPNNTPCSSETNVVDPLAAPASKSKVSPVVFKTEIIFTVPSSKEITTRRYSQTGLSSKTLLRINKMKKNRPTSALVLRQKDTLKARPKSAVTAATTKSTSKQAPSQALKDSPLVFVTESTEDSLGGQSAIKNDNSGNTQASCLCPDKNASKKGNFQFSMLKPRNADLFSRNLKKMSEMENSFRAKTRHLQKKLGIADNGLIF